MEEFLKSIRGTNLSNQQIGFIGNEAQKIFNLSDSAKDDLMLLLLAGTERFNNFIWEQVNLYGDCKTKI